MSLHQNKRFIFSLSNFILITFCIFVTNTAYGQLTPFSCGPEGILTQSDPLPDPSDMLFVNMTSGEVEVVTTLSTHVNAIGYNIVDDFVYGVDRQNGGIIRFGSNGNLETVAGAAVINNRTPVTGDVDDNGHLWLYAGGANEWIQVDLNADDDNADPVQVGSGTPGGLDLDDYSQIVDWTYIPGTDHLYSVTATADNSTAHLLRFDRTSKQFEFVADLGDLGSVNTFGATYTDSDGLLYAGNNGTGVIWRIDVENGTASEFAQGPPTSQNDGARCFNAPIQVEITLTVGPCWRMLSSPVDGLTYADMLDGLWTQGMPGSDYEDGEPNVLIWPDGETGNDPSGWQPPSTLNQEIPAGTGFLISVYGDDNYDGTDDGFPKVITLSGPAHPRDTSPPLNSTPDGWTLTGNPYTQSVDFNELETNDLTDVAYIWDQDSGNWVTTTSDGFGDIPDGIITAGQAFFVQNVATPTDPSITFNDESRTMGGQFYGKQATKNHLHDYLRFEVQGENLFSSLWVRFSASGSDETVYGDALKLQPLSREYALLGARKPDGTLLDIGHFPLNSPEIEIPVHFNATKNGTYTITATDLNLPPGSDLYFSDRQTGESMLIDNRFEYSFTNSQTQRIRPDETDILSCNASLQKAPTSGEDRFLITSTPPNNYPGNELPQQVTLDQNYPNPFNPATIISFNLPQQTDIRLEIFDMAGRQVATLAEGIMQAGIHTINFDASHLSSGIYMYTLLADGISITKKLTLIK